MKIAEKERSGITRIWRREKVNGVVNEGREKWIKWTKTMKLTEIDSGRNENREIKKVRDSERNLNKGIKK